MESGFTRRKNNLKGNSLGNLFQWMLQYRLFLRGLYLHNFHEDVMIVKIKPANMKIFGFYKREF
jgi:hypothetical protein